MTFQFYSETSEDLERLWGNEEQCIAYLRACQPLATKLATVAGVYTPLTEEDERVLQGFHLGKPTFRVESLFREKEPVIYQAETIAIFEQWLHKPDDGGKGDG